VEDLIQNAAILFEERPLHSSHVPPPHMVETTSTGTFLSSELSRSTEARAAGSTTRYLSGLVGDTPTSTPSSFTSHSDSLVDGRLPSLLVPLLSPPVRGLSLSQLSVETTMQEQDTSETLPTLSSQRSVAPASVAEWWLPHPGLHQHPEEPTIPLSPPESVRSITSDVLLSPASFLSNPTESSPSPTASL
jgi:hypothetical protein